jgi:23S rRNA A2030 N6-methylase RlmJ
VTVKVLGSTFRPLIYQLRTDADGFTSVRAALPHFKTGRAAILIRAVASGYEAELRRIIQQG